MCVVYTFALYIKCSYSRESVSIILCMYRCVYLQTHARMEWNEMNFNDCNLISSLFQFLKIIIVVAQVNGNLYSQTTYNLCSTPNKFHSV